MLGMETSIAAGSLENAWMREWRTAPVPPISCRMSYEGDRRKMRCTALVRIPMIDEWSNSNCRRRHLAGSADLLTATRNSGPRLMETNEWRPARMDCMSSPVVSIKDSMPQITPMNPARLAALPCLENMGFPALESTKKCFCREFHSMSPQYFTSSISGVLLGSTCPLKTHPVARLSGSSQKLATSDCAGLRDSLLFPCSNPWLVKHTCALTSRSSSDPLNKLADGDTVGAAGTESRYEFCIAECGSPCWHPPKTLK
mmetsp:Transcript_9965/g.25677  ORF Transcript_9965/g.25677 Transcript_9965/m.25677 type:complete len:257 (-) Transcript_9965:515-1285(-)